MKKQLIALLVAGALLSDLATEVRADDDYAGKILYHNDVRDFFFTLSARSHVRIFTSSFNKGGFDSMLTLWDGSGNYLHFNDDNPYETGHARSNGVSYYFGPYDSLIETVLKSGSYSVTLSAYDNGSITYINRTDGFYHDGDIPITITSWDAGTGYIAENGMYELHITSEPAPEPEPAGMLLLGAGVAALSGFRRIKNQESTPEPV
jgi:hypothetical protein